MEIYEISVPEKNSLISDIREEWDKHRLALLWADGSVIDVIREAGWALVQRCYLLQVKAARLLRILREVVL